MSQKYYQDDYVTLYHGDCLDILRDLPENSIDSVVTDPPYGFSTSSSKLIVETVRAWVSGDISYVPSKGDSRGMSDRSDSTVGAWDIYCPPPSLWAEVLRVLKPGGFVISSCAPRNADIMMFAIRLAGFEMRDQIAWIRGGGMPKGYNIGKQVTAFQRGYPSEAKGIAAAAREDGGVLKLTEDGKKYSGWASRMKPANEPLIVARKPHEGTIAENVLKYGVGGLNIDGGRYGGPSPSIERKAAQRKALARGAEQSVGMYSRHTVDIAAANESDQLGRWPTNVALDDTMQEELISEFPQAESLFPTFRYAAKATGHERPKYTTDAGKSVRHPTVKPLELMRWLVRLVTPRGGVVLEPFAGSGTTAEACVAEELKCIAIEREESYLPLIVQRLTRETDVPLDLGGVQ